ncbi:MAG: TonB-dependent receptor [Parvularculaceae bacterium]
MTIRSFRAAVAVGASAVALAGAASAQITTGGAGEGFFADTIVVTAQFREQSVLEVPIAVTAYDGEFLDSIGVDEFDELAAFVPGLIVQEQSVNNPGFVIRGITSDDGSSNIEQRVSVFQNGVSIARSRGSIVPFLDLERVEVLNGPQGTLFGRSAQIGAVQIVTNKPTNAFEGYAAAEFGNFDQQKYEAALNVPLIDDVLAFRAAAFYERRSGFIENTSDRDLNGVDTFAARASLRFTPTERATIDLIGHFVKNSPPGTSFKSGVIPAIGGNTDPNDFASLNTFGNIGDILGQPNLSIERELFDVTLIANVELTEALTLTSTGAYREFDSVELFDPDGTGLDLLVFAEDAEAEQFSWDARFQYDDGGKFTGFFGGGVFLETGEQRVPLGFDLGGLALFSTFGAVPDPLPPGADVILPAGLATPANLGTFAALLTGDPAVFAPTGLTQVEEVTNFADNFSFDIFGEVTYEIAPGLEFTAGGRFTRDDKESLLEARIIDPNPFVLGAVAAGTNAGRAAFGLPPVDVVSVIGGDSGGVLSSDAQDGLDDTFSGFSWRAVLNYEFQPGRFVYFNYSRGRRPEVLEENLDRDGTDADNDGVVGDILGEFVIVPAETVDSFEVGFKGRFLNDRLTVESAAYYYDYTNFQTSIAVNEPGTAPEFDLINAGNAESYGVELQLIATLSDNLELFGTYGYNRSRFDDVDGDGNPQQFAGNRFRLAPDHSFSVGANYARPVSDTATAFFRPTYTWKSEVFFTDENELEFDVVNPLDGSTLFTVPTVGQEAFGLLNVNAGVSLYGGAVVVEGYAKNLLDREFIIDGGNTGGAFQIPTFIAGAPRFYGGGVTVRF